MSSTTARRYHAFLSYSHEDREVARRLRRWLTEDAGFEIWFDESHLEPGAAVAGDLAAEMADCRNWILLASKSAAGSAWVTAEFKAAVHHATLGPAFNLIVLRLDSWEPTREWAALESVKWLEAPGGELTLSAARAVIDRLDHRPATVLPAGLPAVYISRGWQTPDRPFGDNVCSALCSSRWSLRLIGDAPDQRHFALDRIRQIMQSCSGHVAILPRRGGPSPTDHDYRYLLAELQESAALGLPAWLVAEEGTALPPSLASQPVQLLAPGKYLAAWATDPPDELESFLEKLVPPPRPSHLFLAAELDGTGDRAEELRNFLAAVTGIDCRIGLDYEGGRLRDQIAAGLASAAVVVANIAGPDASAPGGLVVNTNTCVEAGIAEGAFRAMGIDPPPVFLTAQCEPRETGKSAQIPFMLRDSQITWYTTDAEWLGHCRRLLWPFRRRIMNYEFAEPE